MGSQSEALARYGMMCEDKGRHGVACECYYAARVQENANRYAVLDWKLDEKSTSHTLTLSRLSLILGLAREDEERSPPPAALAAFREAVRLAPGDLYARYFLADGLRRAGQFREAQAALEDVARRDTGGRLTAAVAKNLADIHSGSRYR